MDTLINSSFFQRSFPSNSTSKGRRPESPADEQCNPEFWSNNVTQYSPRPCHRSTCTNPSCRIVVREHCPNADRNTEYPSQNDGNSNQMPRDFRGIRRPIGILRESTPRPESVLETSNIEQGTPRQRCCRNNNQNCRIISSPTTKQQTEHPSLNVGHSSHIPRSSVPKPSQFNIPSFMDKEVGTEAKEIENQFLFGLVRLKQNDVCYTSGTIEWVGRKRTYPVNSGFKTLDLNDLPGHEPMQKKIKTCGNVLDDIRECDCVEMLPTVNAIVDHLNALHEAVDLIDLRLNAVEDTM